MVTWELTDYMRFDWLQEIQLVIRDLTGYARFNWLQEI